MKYSDEELKKIKINKDKEIRLDCSRTGDTVSISDIIEQANKLCQRYNINFENIKLYPGFEGVYDSDSLCLEFICYVPKSSEEIEKEVKEYVRIEKIYKERELMEYKRLKEKYGNE